jgi:RNA polymerase sigma-70 factor (ECF subfamily)
VPARRSKAPGGHGRLDDERKLELLFTAHADEVLTYLRHRTDHDTAQEVLTEVFVVAWRKLDRVPVEPRGWLYAVARRVLANHVGSERAASSVTDQIAARAKPRSLSVVTHRAVHPAVAAHGFSR